MSGAELAAAAAQEAAEAVRNDWTDDDEKAYWDEWKRINGEPLWWWWWSVLWWTLMLNCGQLPAALFRTGLTQKVVCDKH